MFKPEPPHGNMISDLPDELVQLILHFLPHSFIIQHAVLISKQFLQAALSNGLFVHIRQGRELPHRLLQKLYKATVLNNVISLEIYHQDRKKVSFAGFSSPNFKHLTRLRLKSVYLSLDHVKCIMQSGNVQKLRELDLSENYEIGANSMQYIYEAKLDELESLDLNGCRIGKEGLKLLLLGRNRSLEQDHQVLHSSSSSSSNTSSQWFLKNLTHLNLADNELYDEGATLIANRCFPHLTHLNLAQNYISHDGVDAITMNAAANFKSLRKLTLDRYNDNHVLSPISVNWVRLNRVFDGTESKRVETSVRYLTSMPCFENAQIISLNENSITDEGLLEILDRSKNVTDLSLAKNLFTIQGAKSIGSATNLNKLTRLDLSRNSMMSNEGIRSILKNPSLRNLTTLILNESRSSQEDYMLLFNCPYLSNLTQLDICFVTRFSKAGVKALGSSPYLTKLTALHMDGTITCDEASCFAHHCKSLQNLKLLSLGSCFLGEQEESILKNSLYLQNVTSLNTFTYIERD
ncbi:hypothetical protein C9374_004652 [Naegleria lovaniensis]|uniref:F-box domain-containing protein n=1 Tax=Naegleria lovaniensis TaxID=51637 RepID=A0AA88KL68_NAELO|nr:uncharacterized protein C9374_004652 [Naegleria lovaniensis]KAG2383315.1 hypothetical protein C9374_004652 [Naegleria lovaniensis]